jgi:hypothetical protein
MARFLKGISVVHRIGVHLEMSTEIQARGITGISKESLALMSVCIFDTILTIALIVCGYATEANPLMALCFEHGIAVFCLAKLGPLALLVCLAEWYRRQNPEFTRRALLAGTAGYLVMYFIGVAGVNIH